VGVENTDDRERAVCVIARPKNLLISHSHGFRVTLGPRSM
jgi:hypothetical protein